MTSKELNVLSIDGGGVRGLIPAKFLAALEAQIGKPLTDIFDAFAGTSSGSISAFGLSAGIFRASELPDMFTSTAQNIFHNRRLARIGARRGVFGPKYQATNLEAVLAESFGPTRMGDLRKPSVATAFDLAARAPVYFSNVEGAQFSTNPMARTICDPSLKVADVVRASSAAPIFFRPVAMDLPSPVGHRPQPATLVDGGLTTNNPSLLAAVLANVIGQHASPSSNDLAPKIRVVSISTDAAPRHFNHQRAYKWGIFDWIRPVTTALMQAQNDLTDTALNLLVPEVTYERIGIDWTQAPNKHQIARLTDNASDRNLAALAEVTDWSIDQQRQRLGDLAARLKA